jgi:ornithine cyclodeaminase/alanine dehydrogenase-like protein (mu-crystallin family)
VVTLVLRNAEIEHLLDMADCLEAMEHAFRDLGEGRATNRPRTHAYTPLGPDAYYLFKSMDGALPRYGVHALRLSSDHLVEVTVGGRRRKDKLPKAPGNRFVGLVLLFSIETLELLAVLQDGFLQKLRVGATSGVAAKYCSRADSRVLGLFGAGWQADAQILAHCAVRPLELVKVYSPSREHRERLCATLRGLVEAELRPVHDPRAVVEGSDIVACATNALEPVFDGDWLVPGQHVNSLQRGELDARTHERAEIIVTRAAELSLHYAPPGAAPSDVELAETFDPRWQGKLRELGKIVAGRQAGRECADQLTLFGGSGSGPSSGLGIQFAAVGAVIYQRARERGLGYEVPSELFLEDVHP